MANQVLKKNILAVVSNQINGNNPECARQTFERLVNSSYSEKKAKEMIGAVLIKEMYEILKEQRPFNEQKYVEELKNLR